MFSNKSIRSWIASFLFLSLIIFLVLFLTYTKIPQENKDIVVSIIGTILGGLSAALSIFIGRDPDDIQTLKAKISELNDDRSTLIARLRDQHILAAQAAAQIQHLQDQIIDKLSVFVGREKLIELGTLPEEVEKWIPKENQGEEGGNIPQPMSPPRVDPADFKDF